MLHSFFFGTHFLLLFSNISFRNTFSVMQPLKKYLFTFGTNILNDCPGFVYQTCKLSRIRGLGLTVRGAKRTFYSSLRGPKSKTNSHSSGSVFVANLTSLRFVPEVRFLRQNESYRSILRCSSVFYHFLPSSDWLNSPKIRILAQKYEF